MPEFSIQIKNLSQIRAAFRKAPVVMARELNTAIKRSIFTIEGESKKNTPVDTGTLRASTRSMFAFLRGEVGTNVFYGLFVHEGTKFTKGRPYLLNAVKSKELMVQEEFTGAVDRALKQIGDET